MTDNTEQRAAVERAVEEAMQEAWNEICSDTNCCPLDIIRHRGKTFFEPRHWSALTAKLAADAILAAQPAPLGEGERAVALERLQYWLSETPDYDGDDPRANHYRRNRQALTTAIAALAPAPLPTDPVACAREMTPEEIRADNIAARAQMIAAYTGPVVSFDVAEPFYLGSCDSCGWVGSTEVCPHSDDDDVICPRCFAGGCDCGKVASLPAALSPSSPVEGGE